jgi:predicted aspartyl protease
MIRGEVNDHHEIRVRLPVLDGLGYEQVIDGILDTGFDGALALPHAQITSLQLPLLNEGPVRLGDGREEWIDYYEATVIWDGIERVIPVPALNGDILIGMALLSGYDLRVRVAVGGEVRRMAIPTRPYQEQAATWPKTGRHILAHYDDESVIVYQAYNPSIGRFAVEHGRLGGEFSYSRMSWVKPNFLWMMYRSGWGTKENQEMTLALRLRRAFFETILSEAVPSSWDRDAFATQDEWASAVARSSVRLQWDPDHHPSGAKLERRAIQLGMRGGVLEAFGQRELLEVIDLTELVAEQRANSSKTGVSALLTPAERVYVPADPAVVTRLGLSMGPE